MTNHSTYYLLSIKYWKRSTHIIKIYPWKTYNRIITDNHGIETGNNCYIQYRGYQRVNRDICNREQLPNQIPRYSKSLTIVIYKTTITSKLSRFWFNVIQNSTINCMVIEMTSRFCSKTISANR
jgi:hypothetical protein